MQGKEEVQPLRYELRGMGHTPEDILFCVDADAEVSVEMKLGTQGKGLCRLDAIKQAIILFVHSKLMAHVHHQFAFTTLRNSASWVKDPTTALEETSGRPERATKMKARTLYKNAGAKAVGLPKPSQAAPKVTKCKEG